MNSHAKPTTASTAALIAAEAVAQRAVAGVALYTDSRPRQWRFTPPTPGLLSALPRKSVEPVTALFVTDPAQADAVHQRLLHFLGSAPSSAWLAGLRSR